MKRRRRRGESGQALVETAIIMPIMVFAVLGAVQLMMMQHGRRKLSTRTRSLAGGLTLQSLRSPAKLTNWGRKRLAFASVITGLWNLVLVVVLAMIARATSTVIFVGEEAPRECARRCASMGYVATSRGLEDKRDVLDMHTITGVEAKVSGSIKFTTGTVRIDGEYRSGTIEGPSVAPEAPVGSDAGSARGSGRPLRLGAR